MRAVKCSKTLNRPRKNFLLLFLFRDSRSKVDKHTRSQSPFLHYSRRWMFLFHLFATFVFLSGCAVSVRVTQSHSIPRKQSQNPSELEIKKEKNHERKFLVKTEKRFFAVIIFVSSPGRGKREKRRVLKKIRLEPPAVRYLLVE